MKKNRYHIVLILCLIAPLFAGSQSSYFIPKEMKRAYANKTRSFSGQPGAQYWQNRADYKMQAEWDAKKRTVEGEASIVYYNNSPDTLNNLIFNIYQDINRIGNSRDWDIGQADIHKGTKIHHLRVGDVVVDVNDKAKIGRQGTKLNVRSGYRILPYTQTPIQIGWTVELPSEHPIRMGIYGDSAIFAAYWYPQIAVYDDVDGWDMISYGGSVEFYNEFGDYDVTIKTPEKFAVWASGELQNAAELYQADVVERIKRAQKSDEIIGIVEEKHLQHDLVFLKKSDRVWHFKAKNVSDFSFALGKNFCWDATSMLADTLKNQRVFISSVYPVKAKGFEKVAGFSRQSIHYMSFTMPGIAFPYPSMTTFCNGLPNGGMETPMMANNGNLAGDAALFGVTFHEIAHSYFPFYMGTNEKKYAWMDEGWAALWPGNLSDSLYPNHNYLENTVKNYENSAAKETDIPPMIPNQFLAAYYPSLRLASYLRPALTYYFLEEMLETSLFLKAMHQYVSSWNGKHPTPLDFIRTFEAVADQNLEWFFGPWLYEHAYADLGIIKVTNKGEIVIENRGGLPLPVNLEILYADQKRESIRFGPEIWNEKQKSVVVETDTDKKIAYIRLGNRLIPDVNRNDNEMYIMD